MILNWNRKECTKQTIKSLSNQTFKDFEIIVMDNNSTDGSAEMIKKEFPYVKLIEMHENRGILARNIGLKNAKGEYVFSLDNDSFVKDKDILKKIIKRFESEPNLGIIACNILDPKTEKISNWFHCMPEEDHNKEFLTFSFGAGASIIRKKILDKTGYWFEEFLFRGEEYDMAYRVYDNEYYIKYCPEIIMYHDSNPSGRVDSYYYYLNKRNMLWVYWLDLPFFCAIKRTCKTIIADFFRLKPRYITSYLKSIFHFLIGLPRVFRKRKAIKKETLKKINKINKTGNI